MAVFAQAINELVAERDALQREVGRLTAELAAAQARIEKLRTNLLSMYEDSTEKRKEDD
jgi:predicted nuclease with TOPRIM domain